MKTKFSLIVSSLIGAILSPAIAMACTAGPHEFEGVQAALEVRGKQLLCTVQGQLKEAKVAANSRYQCLVSPMYATLTIEEVPTRLTSIKKISENSFDIEAQGFDRINCQFKPLEVSEALQNKAKQIVQVFFQDLVGMGASRQLEVKNGSLEGRLATVFIQATSSSTLRLNITRSYQVMFLDGKLFSVTTVPNQE